MTEDEKLTVNEAITAEGTDTPNTESAKATAYEPKSTKADILKRLREIAQDVEHMAKSELDFLKQNFYRLHKTQTEAARKAFVEQGGEESAFVPQPDVEESAFQDIVKAIKEKRNQLAAELERLKDENLTRKLAIIDRLKALLDTPEEVNKNYNDFKQLQQEWNDIKLIPANKVNELWKTYQHLTEKFYDILKLNNEFREYDFKKNLEIKTRLCEAAERLATEDDVVSAFHQLQKLHQEFRDTGPVNKELREDIWTRFKTASTIINRRHQQHFEQQKEAEQHNLDQKTVICEIVESTEYDTLKTFADWESKTQEILALQAKWKTIGFAPQKMNVKIFERFRTACDNFFKRKDEYFKTLKEGLSENLEKKKALCEQAEALKDSTEWKKAAETFAKLQKEWKTIGPVQKKYSDALWKRFISACDYFFEQRTKATHSERSAQTDNLNKKKAIIEQLKAYQQSEASQEIEKEIRGLIKEWNNTGHVPFKEKDKLYKEFRTVVDNLFDTLNLSAAQRKLDDFKSNLKEKGSNAEGDLIRERKKLARTYDTIKNEIKNYENNLGALTFKSEKGNSLVKEINRKIEKLKADLELINQKIKAIDDSLRA